MKIKATKVSKALTPEQIQRNSYINQNHIFKCLNLSINHVNLI
jgi:hypothetical protein